MEGTTPGRGGPLEEEMATPPGFLPGESLGQRAWRATVLGVAQSGARLSTHCFLHRPKRESGKTE